MKYTDAESLLEGEFPIAVRRYLYPIFERGEIAFNEIMEDPLYQSSFSANISGWLSNFLVCRQFEPDMLDSGFPLEVEIRRVNNFNYKALFLHSKHAMVNVAKGSSMKNAFPGRSKYRLRACQNNNILQNTLFWDFEDGGKIVEDKYFLLLTYHMKMKELAYVNLMVPDVNMVESLKTYNLKSEIHVYPQNKVEDEPIITGIKEEALEALKQKKKLGGINE